MIILITSNLDMTRILPRIYVHSKPFSGIACLLDQLENDHEWCQDQVER